MKRPVILSLTLSLIFVNLILAQENAEKTLLTIGDKQISKAEFLRIYKKNNMDSVHYDEQSVRDYLELFINFKLKVIEAENQDYDEVPEFKNELAGYRKQLAKPYLSDAGTEEKLLKEAYERMKSEVHASHILVRISPDAPPADTIKAHEKIMDARKRILDGEDFAKVAKEVSEDPSVNQNNGDLGYFTAFQMVYPFENAAFKTEVGEISKPVRSRFGYHLIKVHDKRPASGEIKVSHIMVGVPRGMDPDSVEEAKDKIFNIYDSIQSGYDFAEMAKKYSDDKRTGRNGGELPYFGIGRMVKPFEEAAFALEKDGQISEPVKTSYGWHIIKRLEKKSIGTYEEEKTALSRKVSKDLRAEKSREAVVQKLKKEYNLKENRKALKEFYEVVDQSIFSKEWDIETASELNKELFSFANTSINQQEFANYLYEKQSKRKAKNIELYVNEQYEKFLEETMLAYEESVLEEKYADFRHLMQEYHDGILLFEITDDMVWSKAVEDTAGLHEFYNKNKQNYMWGKRLHANIFKVKDEKNAKKAMKFFLKIGGQDYTTDQILNLLNEKEKGAVTLVDSALFPKGSNEYVDKLFDVNAPIVKNFPEDNIIVQVIEILKPAPKKLSEARGIITADYQNYLEEKWIEKLRDKYTIKVHEEVLQEIFSDN